MTMDKVKEGGMSPFARAKFRFGGECHPAVQLLMVDERVTELQDRVDRLTEIVMGKFTKEAESIPVDFTPRQYTETIKLSTEVPVKKKMGRPKGSKNKQ